ncbi:L-threonylcarbamoyladenylate synthase [Synechococcus elongatus]|uniref:Translation factor SUA5 n=2 Tax=Synechococcus elongatus TaxID=32046 RepID=Q31KN9_SYNE7|nr:L-threonylcarbamoyladenylate synthase [Synechococcus elongatus]ABB58380.1 translation factor SUA5 [Synechococcus elongatus PCC 7942 = FACHB-805]AJD57156.1 hypothetical protein M744_04515 [Synechococcus elongatus UTEX 2973]MBD2587102.1 threonylcarbamoyl-AMP synthase [Synechococcus elongatus FACHB-242]MBD2688173.1 threonylcarbamoyl-AMP synthase [Synechococcus elongatus FACHB-1061]MBD2706116.1 threonylcarbamoyl-AMP synthase [Synechococcus elongatus PCC 7942 = FACHB-805]
MAKHYRIHPDSPQPQQIAAIAEALRQGAVILYPTDSVYAIGCDVKDRAAVQRVRRIKEIDNDKPLTFICPSLSVAAQYGCISDRAFRLMRELVPGPYTFLLPATPEVPRVVMNPKRRTAGIRIPNNPICQALLQALEGPIISTSAHLQPSDRKAPLAYEQGPHCPIAPAELFGEVDRLVDITIEVERQEMRILGADPDYQVSTVLDLTDDWPLVLRRGLGWEALEPLGLLVEA